MLQVDTYKDELERMQRVTREEYVAILRRDSSGFARGASKYRGVAKYVCTHAFLEELLSSIRSTTL